MSYSKKCQILEIVSSNPLPQETARSLDDFAEALDDLLTTRTDIIRAIREEAKRIQPVFAVSMVMGTLGTAGAALLFASVVLGRSASVCPPTIVPFNALSLVLLLFWLIGPFTYCCCLNWNLRRFWRQMIRLLDQQDGCALKVLEALDSFDETIPSVPSEVYFTLSFSVRGIVPGFAFFIVVVDQHTLEPRIQEMLSSLRIPKKAVDAYVVESAKVELEVVSFGGLEGVAGTVRAVVIAGLVFFLTYVTFCKDFINQDFGYTSAGWAAAFVFGSFALSFNSYRLCKTYAKESPLATRFNSLARVFEKNLSGAFLKD